MHEQLSPQLEAATRALGPVTRLDSTNRYGTIAQLRSISGSLQGAAALFTELARASAAAGVALESSSTALAANAAAVINTAGGWRLVGAGATAVGAVA